MLGGPETGRTSTRRKKDEEKRGGIEGRFLRLRRRSVVSLPASPRRRSAVGGGW